ncbi:YceI family protein [Aestuariimicrobium sp. p3-SID1156]|uniref:YceI family protein n=1 Tax=Aestuariimicrobium sp. p3-SID1156 TaxID=2916038 RepID=UPI00223B5123|nr:YceI family protein [Aestuariimicrobium sp. p3-SID1156]MCT1459304.1 YceI family protein [Aestuariimicrobium sp. p3-SID1156]
MTGLTTINGTFAIDPAHSRLGFVTRHAMVTKVRGSFNDFEGTASGDGQNPESAKVNVTIQTASFDSSNEQRDEHVRGDDFLKTAQFPTMTFDSTKVEVVDEDTLNVTGDLTIMDTAREITIPFDFAGEATDPFGNVRIGFEGKTKISRKDFGLTWNAALETGGVLVSDDVTLEIEISAIKQA